MFKKTGVERRLRKISKNEAASVKLLEKQVKTLKLRIKLRKIPSLLTDETVVESVDT